MKVEKQSIIKKSVITLFINCYMGIVAFAQSGNSDVDRIDNSVKSGVSSVISICSNVATGAIAVGVLWFIFSLVANPQQAKMSGISLIVAVAAKALFVVFGSI